MPLLQSSGAISIANLNSFFPGSGTAMSNFYRGGGRVPSTKGGFVREPASGGLYSASYRFVIPQAGVVYVIWNGTQINGSSGGNVFSFTSGGITYFRGTLREVGNDYWGTPSVFEVHREYNSTVNINTGIPASGQISLSQFYGAETP